MLKNKSISKLLATTTLFLSLGGIAVTANAYLTPNQFYNYVDSILVQNKINLLPSNINDNPRYETGIDVKGTKFTKNIVMVHPGAVGIEYFVGKKSKKVYGVITTVDTNYVPKVPYSYVNLNDAYQLALVSAASLNRQDNYQVAYGVMVELYKTGMKQYRETKKPVSLKVQDYKKLGYDYELYIQPFKGSVLLQTRAFRNIFKYQAPVTDDTK